MDKQRRLPICLSTENQTKNNTFHAMDYGSTTENG